MHKPYILAVRQLGGIGDCLMMSCVYRGLREKYPHHTIKLATAEIYLGGALMDIAERNPFIDEIHPIEPYDCTTQRTKDVWGKYFSAQTPNIEDELIWKMADITIDLNTACVDYEWSAMDNGGIEKPRYVIWCEHAGVIPSSYAPVYRIDNAERASAQAYAAEHWGGQTVIGVGLSACDKKRALGIGKLEAICKALSNEGLYPVTIDPTCTIPGVDYLINKRVREVMPLLEQMAVVVSVDSGILHMSGTVGTPVVGLFGPTDQRMRMGNYIGSATDSRKLLDCAPCWYKYPCDSQQWFRHKPFECLSRIPIGGIVEETLRWVEHSRKT